MAAWNYLRFLFRLFCVATFAYKGTEVLLQFLDYGTVNKLANERQENHDLPMVCLESPIFAEDKLSHLDLNVNKYSKTGAWIGNISNSDAETVYNFISPNLTDLVSKIQIKRRVDAKRDAFEKIKFSGRELENKSGSKGVDILQMSYYDDFKIYCYNISTHFNIHGIESIYIYTKNIKQIMLIISPGNLYTFERKRNLVYILPRLDYEFQVYHSIAVKEFYKLILPNLTGVWNLEPGITNISTHLAK